MAPRFLVDLNMGRLVVWLRVLGYDGMLVRRRLVTRGVLRALLFRSDQLWAQL